MKNKFNLEELIAQKLKVLEADIVAGTYKNENDFQKGAEHMIKLMINIAILEGMVDKDQIQSELEKKFIPQATTFYQNYQKMQQSSTLSRPVDYKFQVQEERIKSLFQDGQTNEAKTLLDSLSSLVNDDALVKDAIADGLYSKEDIEYFKNVSYPQLLIYPSTLNDKKMNLGKRIASGVSFIFTGKNPYDNQSVKIKKEKVKKTRKEKKADNKFVAWTKKHKIAVTSMGLAVLAGAGITISALANNSSNKTIENDALISTASFDYDSFARSSIGEMKTFEVDEFHNFNINDQETHTEKLQALAQEFMEKGIPVVSEEECMKLDLKSELAVSPEQLNNFLISLNLEDIDELTFTKLLVDSNTDKEQLSSDFRRVNHLLGYIYTTKIEEPFIYRYIANKEYSEYIKIYEDAIIQNQKGNSEDLIDLIHSRIDTPVAATSSGVLGMLSTSLIFEQENVYNSNVLSQPIMDAYNRAGSMNCSLETVNTDLYSHDFAEYMRKLDSKLEAMRTYTGIEQLTYDDYLSKLPDSQRGNKVYIESQVLPFLELNNIEVGKWEVIPEIANASKVADVGNTQGTYYSTSSSNTTTQTTIVKAPTTKEEKEIQAATEAELEEHNRSVFEDTVKDDATKLKNGNFKISVKDEQPIIVDSTTMGAYDEKNDYDGNTYAEGEKGYNQYLKDHAEDVQYVEGVGYVVVTDDGYIKVSNENITKDKYGNLIDESTGKKIFGNILMSEEEIDQYMENHPELEEYLPVDESEITYSKVDDVVPEEGKKPSLSIPNGNNGNNGGNTGGNGNTGGKTEETDSNKDQNVSLPADIDMDVFNGLTEEEKKAYLEMINSSNGVYDDTVQDTFEETFESTIYGYEISALINNPALCANIPEEVLIEYTEVWEIYQSWLASQNSTSNYSAQIKALEEEKAFLESNTSTEDFQKIL